MNRSAKNLLSGLAAMLALMGSRVSAQYTSDSFSSNTSGASASSSQAPATSSRTPGWHPARPARAAQARPSVQPFIEDNSARPIGGSISAGGSGPSLGAASPLAMNDEPAPLARDSLLLRSGGDYLPAWQRSPRDWASDTGEGPMIGPSRLRATTISRQTPGAPAAPGAPGAGNRAAPFVEDEIVPQPTGEPASSDVQFQNGDAINGLDHCSQCGGGGPCDAMGMCGTCACDPTACERFHVCSPLSFLNELSILAGVQAFKGPVDQGINGNFGYHAGFNMGDAIWHQKGLGYQFGLNYMENNFKGNQVAGFTPGSRRQVFMTAGLFHRAFYGTGWQGGAVVDYLDDRYYYNATLYQIRAELSYVAFSGNEFGVMTTTRSRNATVFAGGITQTITPINMYSAFYRRTFASGSYLRGWIGATDPIYGGFTPGYSSLVLGSDFRMALTNRIDFVGAYNFLASTQGGVVGQQNEAWGLNMSLVFYPARYKRGVNNGPYRPLFNVADNSTFMLDRRVP